MKKVGFVFLIFVYLIFFITISKLKAEDCYLKELLRKIELKYDISLDKKVNFYDLYMTNINIYQKILEIIKTQKNYKHLLSCNNEDDCNIKAKQLAYKLTFIIRKKDKWNNFGILLKNSTLYTINMLWRQTQNAYGIAINSFLEPYKETLQYALTVSDQILASGGSFINNMDKNIFVNIAESLIPNIRNIINKNNIYSKEQIIDLLNDIKRLLEIIKNDKESQLASLAQDLLKVSNDLENIKLYNEAFEEIKNNKSCIDLSFFSKTELEYLNNLPAYNMETLLLNIANVIKDICKIINTKKSANTLELLSSMYNGTSFLTSQKETETSNILTFYELMKKKIKL